VGAVHFPHIPPLELPGPALVAELYLETRIRSVEIGTLMFGKPDPDGREQTAPMELVRLAIPRRAYAQSHVDDVVAAVEQVWERRDAVRGFVGLLTVHSHTLHLCLIVGG